MLQYLTSRTVITLIILATVIFVPEVREGLKEVLPQGLESDKILEGFLLALAGYFRVNPKAKL